MMVRMANESSCTVTSSDVINDKRDDDDDSTGINAATTNIKQARSKHTTVLNMMIQIL